MKNLQNLIGFLFIFWMAPAQLISGQTGSLPHLASGHLERIPDFPSKYVETRTIDVWLPPGFHPKGRYAVLYMHDGQMLFDTSKTWNHQEWGVDETVGKLIQRKAIIPTIVVGIWNVPHIRYADYFPAKPFLSLDENSKGEVLALGKSNFGKSMPGGVPHSDNYLRFIVEELKPMIDRKYPTYTDAGHTFIAGSSMGGLISMYAICEYPNIFGGAACLSTHWSGLFDNHNMAVGQSFIKYLDQYSPLPGDHRLYFDYGTITLDSLYAPFQVKVDSLLKAKGYGKGNLMSKKFKGEPHTEMAWQKRLHIPVEYLLGSPISKRLKPQLKGSK